MWIRLLFTSLTFKWWNPWIVLNIKQLQKKYLLDVYAWPQYGTYFIRYGTFFSTTMEHISAGNIWKKNPLQKMNWINCMSYNNSTYFSFVCLLITVIILSLSHPPSLKFLFVSFIFIGIRRRRKLKDRQCKVTLYISCIQKYVSVLYTISAKSELGRLYRHLFHSKNICLLLFLTSR
jgi:hypothetical protein